MKPTVIFDIDGVLTDMWPVESAVLKRMCPRKVAWSNLRRRYSGNLYRMYCAAARERPGKMMFRQRYREVFEVLRAEGKLPDTVRYAAARFAAESGDRYRFVYATVASAAEAEYVLMRLGIADQFDTALSINRDNNRYTKASGRPFQRLRKLIGGPLLLITDSQADERGATAAEIASIVIGQDAQLHTSQVDEYFNLYNGGQL